MFRKWTNILVDLLKVKVYMTRLNVPYNFKTDSDAKTGKRFCCFFWRWACCCEGLVAVESNSCFRRKRVTGWDVAKWCICCLITVCMSVKSLCVRTHLKGEKTLDKKRLHFVGRYKKAVCELSPQVCMSMCSVTRVWMLYSQSAWAQMRQAAELLKKVRSPATARLMSVLVGLRSSVVKRGNWTFRISSGATLT